MKMIQASARAHSNIALIKYWGKRDEILNLPAVGSISITLQELFTESTLKLDENLQDDFQKILKMAGITLQLTIPVVNRTLERPSDYRQHYSKLSQKIIEFVCYNDLKRYGYTF